MIKWLLKKIPGKIAKYAGKSAAWLGPATVYVDDFTNVYFKVYAYKKWDKTLKPAQYLYQHTVILYKNSKRNKVAASTTRYSYGY